MKRILYILLIIHCVYTQAQDETGYLEDGTTYNVQYSLIVPKELKIIDSCAHKLIRNDTMLVADSVKTRYILLGVKNQKSIETATFIKAELERGANFDSLALIYEKDKNTDISHNYTGWFTKGKMLIDYELFCFTQDSQKIGWVNTPFGLILIQILDKSSGKMKLEVPIYNLSTPFTGRLKEFSPKGQLISVSSWKEGLRDGLTIDFWDNGRKKIQAVFKSGHIWKYYEEWFNNSQIKMKDTFKNGKWKSSKVWKYNGKLISNDNSKTSIKVEFPE
jgi:antitoxin component YwqK of YwqJK toxin-antitoxin module